MLAPLAYCSGRSDNVFRRPAFPLDDKHNNVDPAIERLSITSPWSNQVGGPSIVQSSRMFSCPSLKVVGMETRSSTPSSKPMYKVRSRPSGAKDRAVISRRTDGGQPSLKDASNCTPGESSFPFDPQNLYEYIVLPAATSRREELTAMMGCCFPGQGCESGRATKCGFDQAWSANVSYRTWVNAFHPDRALDRLNDGRGESRR